MEPFRVLVLVLASDTDPTYRNFQQSWRQVFHPRADILFVKADPTAPGEDAMDGTTITIRCPETLDHVYEKQLRAFKLLGPRLHRYAFVFRTNLSSFVDIQLYLTFCTTLPRSGVYSGVIGYDYNTSFASGAGFTITPDLIHRLVAEQPPEVYVDDVSIGAAMQRWGVPIIPAPRVDRTSWGGWALHPSPYTGPVFHRRIKTDNRETDGQTLETLVRQHYQSSFLFKR